MDIPLPVTATDIDTMRRAVLLDPADDLARLAFADACEEAGDIGRAEFVRVQIEAERLRRPGLRASMDDPGFRALAALNRAECRLLDQHWRTWAGCGDVFQEWHIHCFKADVSGPAVAFRRGFVESIALPLGTFMEHAGELFSQHPIVSVTITDKESSRLSSGSAVWVTCGWPGCDTPACLPLSLFSLLDGESEATAKYKRFATPELAHAAINAACVAFGRRLAGLPPLPEART